MLPILLTLCGVAIKAEAGSAKPQLVATDLNRIKPEVLAVQDLGPLRRIPLQDGGRVKPLDSFARDSVRLITGKTSVGGEDPLITVLRLLADPEAAQESPLIEFQYEPAQDALGIPRAERYLSLQELRGNDPFEKAVAAIRDRKAEDPEAKLSRVEDEISFLYSRAIQLSALVAGATLQIVPDPKDPMHKWLTPDQASQKGAPVEAPDVGPAWEAVVLAAGRTDAYPAALTRLEAALAKAGGVSGEDRVKVDREVHYNALRPLQNSGILYFAAFLGFLFAMLFRGGGGGRVYYALGMTLLVGGSVLHGYGLWLRIAIGGRAPLSNLYESMIVLGFALAGFAAFFESIYRARVFGLVSSLLDALLLLAAHHLPVQFGDTGINPLVPVLRSYWMNYHVTCMLTSYALAAITAGLAHLHLFVHLLAPARTALLADLERYHHRVVQVCVLFLGTGLLLGAAWANESWGRYWGWDNKETWALISLLAYVAILHARYVGALDATGTAACSLVAFVCIVTTYYGVNFVIGSEKHSYVSGTPGDFWRQNWPFMAYIGAELALGGWAVAVAKRRALSAGGGVSPDGAGKPGGAGARA